MDAGTSRKHSRKHRNKKSERFHELAHCRWSKTAAPNTINTASNAVSPGSDRDKSCSNDDDNEMIHTETIHRNDSNSEASTFSDSHVVREGVTTDGTVDNCGDLCLFGNQLPFVEFGSEMVVDKEKDDIDLCRSGHTSSSIVSSTSSSEVESSSEYLPTPIKKVYVSQDLNAIELGNSVFLCQITQLQAFIDQVNATSLCYTPHCTGKLIPVNIKHVGLGGSVMVKFSCTGCTERILNLTSLTDIAFSRCMVCSLALQVAFIAGGCMYSQYNKILKQHLGMSVVNATTFYETIKLLHPIVNAMLTEMCNSSKDDMKMLDSSAVGSWQRAITSSDGSWLTRGKFSQNCTFTIRNYVDNSLLYFVHLCMRGKGVDEDQLYHGTAKGEGHAANIAFGQAKQEGMHIEIQWQDGDSSSAKFFRQHYPDEQKSQVMLCSGHMARVHTKQLSELSKQKSFSTTM